MDKIIVPNTDYVNKHANEVSHNADLKEKNINNHKTSTSFQGPQ